MSKFIVKTYTDVLNIEISLTDGLKGEFIEHPKSLNDIAFGLTKEMVVELGDVRM